MTNKKTFEYNFSLFPYIWFNDYWFNLPRDGGSTDNELTKMKKVAHSTPVSFIFKLIRAQKRSMFYIRRKVRGICDLSCEGC